MRFLFCLGLLFNSLVMFSQEKPVLNFNLDFEKVEKGHPVGWSVFGSEAYAVSLDSGMSHSGKYAAQVELKGAFPDFKAWGYTVPGSFSGKKITLSGYVKTENVTEGYAGLWMRIDPNVAFDNMNGRGAKGTTDWTKYEVTLDMNPERTKQIALGGLLVGKGKMWVDNLRVTIDGTDISAVSPYVRPLLPAEKDHEFDAGSGISITSLTDIQRANLYRLGLLWGYLKYYHPVIAQGSLNWDYELFRVLPGILAASDRSAADQLFLNWIQKVGSCQPGAAPEVKLEVKLRPDLDWIKGMGFEASLADQLQKILGCARKDEHYYVGFQGAGNPEFKNESAYASMTFPDAGFRLLALYRYWNIIQYYFPYKHLIGEDWKAILMEFLPRVVAASDETAYTLVMLELIGRVHDTHANVWANNPVLSQYLGRHIGPVEVRFVQDKAVVTRYYDEAVAKEAGLQVGDQIVKVNDKLVSDIIRERLKYTPASNYPTQLRDIGARLLRTNEQTIKIFAKRGRKEFTCTVKSITLAASRRLQSSDSSFRLIRKDIAYIDNEALKRSHLPKIWPLIKDTKGLILDLRNYPSDFPIYDLTGYLMPKETPFVKFTRGSITDPGHFYFETQLSVGRNNPDYYKGKVIILINEISQSSSEFHAMAYRVHPRATVIGSTTAGADGNVSQFYLPGGISTMISGIGVYYPDGSETQRVGIVPDIEIKPTLDGIAKGRDELMEKAIELIDSESSRIQKR